MKRLIAVAYTVAAFGLNAYGQCPTLGQNATFTSADCQPGSNPCVLCPGDQYTLTPTGTNLQPGDCINWYISDMPNFNPYNGQGTLIGCSMLSSPPPNPCNPNPIFLGIMVNACGTEENNEFMGMWSGGGFNVSDLMVSYNDPANDGCGWQTPSGALQAAIAAECPGAIFVGAGETVPANMPVVIFTSSAADFDYNFGGLCATNGTFYVLQSDCAPSTEVFPNSGSGTVTTGMSIGCWSDNITYNLAQIANNNGAFVAEIPIVGTIYGQAGCAWPNFPGLPGTDPIVNVEPLDATVAADQCNNGPFYIVGIYEPLPPGCPQTFTNYLSYDVLCPSPVLGTADLCSSVTNYNLVQIQDPAVPDGTWSGDGVTGTTFNATGLSGPVMLTFTPTSPCGTPATTTINVSEAPTATIDPIPSVCTGGSTTITIQFTGNPDWSFNLMANGVFQNSYSAGSSPFQITVNPTTTTTYSIQSLTDVSGCSGPNVSALAMVSNTTASATLSLVGNDTICSGSNAQLSVDFSGGVPPYDFVYAINGIAQTPVLNISQDPYVFPVTINNNANITMVSVTDDNGCTGSVFGSAIVHALPAPTAVLVSDTVTICSGASDTLRITLNGNNPFSFVYQANGISQTPVMTDSSHYEVIINPVSGPVQYTLFSVNDSICPGTVSGNYRVLVTPVPTATLSGLDTICAGGSAELSIDFTGSGPYTVEYTANNVLQPVIQTITDPYLFTVNPSATTTYALTALTAGGCSGSVSGNATVVIPPAPTAVISGGGQICQGGSGTTVTVTFTGTGPFTFVHSINNVAQASITTTQNPYTFNVNPSVGTGYRLVSMHDAYCSGTVSGIAQVFVFVPASATMSGNATFCDTASTTVMVDFNGSGPFTIEYSINGVIQPEVFTSDDPYFIPVNVNATTVYKLTSVQSPGCTGLPNGMATITVNYAPTYANLDLNCNLAQNTYTVSFTVLNGALPLTLISGSGNFVGNQFTSNPIPIATGYNFLFHDANNCGDVTVSGPSTCNCSTEAGSMVIAPLDVCETEMAMATYNSGFVNDGDDVLMYILHTNPALPLGNILAWSNTPQFGFQAGMTAGTTYYISAIAGNSNGGGQVDVNDPCFKVSQGVPVTFHAAPSGDIGVSDVSVCAGDSVVIDVNFTGTPNFSFTPSLGGVAQADVTGISGSSYSYIIYPTQDVVVTLNNIADQFCPSGMETGQVNITIKAPPAFGMETVACDYVNSTYTITFPVTGVAPYNLSGLLASNSGNTFTSSPIPFGTSYTAYLSDANNCGQDTLTGLGVCNCISDAGVMSQTPVFACQSATLTVPAATMTVLDPNDQLMYILHSGSGTPVGTIFAWSNTPDFSFVAGMLPNVTYYVSSIVGNPDGMGQIDLNDPCLSVATGTPIQWYPVPTATLTTGTFNLCPGQGQALIVSLTGTPNYTLNYTSNGTPFTVMPMQNLFSINAQLQQTATYILTGVTDGHGCPGTVSGQSNVVVHQIPVVAGQDFSCDFNAQTYVYEFDVTIGDLSTINVANMPGTFDPATGHFTSNPIPFGQPYSFVVTDSWGCGNFTGAGVADCSCVTDAGTMQGGNLVLCPSQTATATAATGFNLETGDTLLYYLVSTPSPTTWTILNSGPTPSFSFNPATMTYETTYYIVAAAGNITAGGVDFSDPCVSSAPGPSVIWQTPVTATLSGADTICIGNSAMLHVDFTGNGPYFFSFSDGSSTQALSNIMQNPYSFSVTPTATSNYLLSGITGAGLCLGTTSGAARIQVNQPPQAVNINENCDLTTETYVLSFDISNGAAPNSFYSVSGLQGGLSDTTFTSLTLPGNQAYQVTITDDAGCSSTINGQPNCVCLSEAGSLTNAQNACLPSGTVSAQPAGDADPDADDILHYFLCSDPMDLPNSILAESTSPQFGFLAGMTAETTYYIVVAAGNALGSGALDFNDPCLSTSAAVPVVFHAAPTAALSGTASVCLNDAASFTVQFTGQAPFTYQYAINGTPQATLTSNSPTATINTTNIQLDQTITLTQVQDLNCSGTVSGQATVTLIAAPTASLAQSTTICQGDSATLTLSLSGGSQYDVNISGGASAIQLTGVQNGATFNVSPIGTTTYNISNLMAAGNTCTPTIGTPVTVTVDAVSATINLSDYSGFNVSCPNGADGAINLVTQLGTPPFSAQWSTGASGFDLTGLGSGTYSVTVTDQIGCTWTDEADLTAPAELGIEFETTAPVCFGDATGFIEVTNITGGAGPFNLLLNGDAQGVVDTFPFAVGELTSGDYVIGVEDNNGCISDVDAVVDDPVQLYIDLGRDTTISFGDSLFIHATHNATQVDTFYWKPSDYLRTPDQFDTWSLPLTAIKYSIYLVDSSGCTATDELVVRVSRDHRVFVPNVINPLSEEGNNIVSVWAGSEVDHVNYMRIFDRWGELVFENNDFMPNDPAFGWDGRFHGELVNPAVFVYLIEVTYIDGETEVFKGDVTVVR